MSRFRIIVMGWSRDESARDGFRDLAARAWPPAAALAPARAAARPPGPAGARPDQTRPDQTGEALSRRRGVEVDFLDPFLGPVLTLTPGTLLVLGADGLRRLDATLTSAALEERGLAAVAVDDDLTSAEREAWGRGGTVRVVAPDALGAHLSPLDGVGPWARFRLEEIGLPAIGGGGEDAAAARLCEVVLPRRSGAVCETAGIPPRTFARRTARATGLGPRAILDRAVALTDLLARAAHVPVETRCHVAGHPNRETLYRRVERVLAQESSWLAPALAARVLSRAR